VRLGDFRKETKDLPDDYILDDVMFIEALPGYYDGMPYEWKSGQIIYTDEPKIRFRMLDMLDQFWVICESDKTCEHNKSNYMSKFVKGKNITKDRWESKMSIVEREFDKNWNSEEWQKFVSENNGNKNVSK